MTLKMRLVYGFMQVVYKDLNELLTSEKTLNTAKKWKFELFRDSLKNLTLR